MGRQFLYSIISLVLSDSDTTVVEEGGEEEDKDFVIMTTSGAVDRDVQQQRHSSDLLQIVDGSGEIHGESVQEFIKHTGVEDSGVDYSVVSIMGPQSSGKSTLMNYVFGTRFDEMDALSGRQQTTRGIWLAESPKISGPRTLVMDLEGSDGRERGEDDTSFERQSALFALATSDILMVNMWAKDVGRESGAGKPLLKTIFQVNLKLFQPSPGARRTILMFVFRDKTKTPLEKLKETWEADLSVMWSTLTKPEEYERSSLQDFFELQYASLSNFEDRPEDFMAESVMLRRRFTHDADDDESLLRNGSDKLPGQALALSMVKVWDVIKENKDLNLPAHRVMVATIRCKDIALQQVTVFDENEDWNIIQNKYMSEIVGNFGDRVARILDEVMSGYDEEARYFDAQVSHQRRETLLEELYSKCLVTYETQLALASAKAVDEFKQGMQSLNHGETFSQQASQGMSTALEHFDDIAKTLRIPGTAWNTEVAAREALKLDIESHIENLKGVYLNNMMKSCCDDAEEMTCMSVAPLLEAPPKDLWHKLEKVLESIREKQNSSLDKCISGYGISDDDIAASHAIIDDTVSGCIQKLVKEAANTILPRMKDRFSESFHKDSDGMPRTWIPSLDISKIAKDAKHDAAYLLSQFVVIEYNVSPSDTDLIRMAILGLQETNNSKANTFDIQAAPSWPNVEPYDALLTPAQVRSSWRQFSSDVALSVQQAVATQEANRLARNRTPPVWAIIAMFVLGFNEIISVLRNPLWLLTVLIMLAFAKTVYEELDVEGEMQNGLLPGIMVLSAKFIPTMRKVIHRTMEAFKKILEGPPETSKEGIAESPGPSDDQVGKRSSRENLPGATDGLRRRLATQETDQATDMDIDQGSATSRTSLLSRKDD